MIFEILSVLGPIFIITLIGYLLGRSRVELHPETLSSTVILIATPAMIFSALVSVNVSRDILLTMAVAAVLCVFVSGLIGFCILKLTGLPMRTFLPSLMLPNSGNIGLPLVFLAFGQDGLTLGVSYFFVIALLQHSVGFSIASGSYNFAYILRQPLLYAVASVLLVTSLSITVPEMVMSTAKILSGMMIPAMLILLGTSLATLTVSDLKPALIIAFGRLGAGLLSALIVIWLVSLDGIAAGAVFLMATMSPAIVNHVFAHRYRRHPEQVAGAVMVSTVLTFLCLPVLVWVALQMAS